MYSIPQNESKIQDFACELNISGVGPVGLMPGLL